MTWPTPPLSFRARLTLRWTGSFAVLLAFVSLCIYAGAAHYSRRDLDGQVRMMAANDLSSSAELTEQRHLFADPEAAFEDFGFVPSYGQLLTLEGKVVNATPSLSGRPPMLDVSQLQRAREDPAAIHSTVVHGRRLRVLVLPLRHDGQPHLLAIGVSEGPVQQRLRPLALLLIGVWLGGVAITAMLGFGLASRALEPIDRITTRARAIAGGDFSARLDPPAHDDEIGRMTRLLNDMLERLHSAIETNRHFAADASHELRTPLTAMAGEVDVALKRDRPTAEYRETLRVVRDGLRQMRDLTENLLALARAQERTVERFFEEVPLETLVAAAVERASSIAAARRVTLHADRLDALVVYGDPRLYARVLDNLLSNAVHYNRDGGTVTIDARCVEAASDAWVTDRVIVTVSDTGIGIPAGEWERIFERFRRVDSPPSRRRVGAGLGLAICRAVVTLYGGEVKVAASSAAGTTFEVDLPGRRIEGTARV
jgi:signal transduction histidine kinase